VAPDFVDVAPDFADVAGDTIRSSPVERPIFPAIDFCP
jgi:hypothetical protein